MKNFLIGTSLVAVGVWYFHHAMNYTRAPEEEGKPAGEIVVANAPDGSLKGRWGYSPTPAPKSSR